MSKRKVQLAIAPTLREAIIISWQERRFIFNLALLSAILIAGVDILIGRISNVYGAEAFTTSAPLSQQLSVLGLALLEWVIGIPFVIGWVLLLNDNITRRASIITVLKHINIIWHFLWRSLIFVFCFALCGIALGSLGVFLLRFTPFALAEKYQWMLPLTMLIFSAPFFFLSFIDFILNKEFEPLLLIRHAYHSYIKIFLTLWILLLLFSTILSLLTLVITMLLAMVSSNNIAQVQENIQHSMAFSFLFSFVSNLFFFWLCTASYTIAYRYWRSIS
ncbi:MAG: hypothetical protein ORN57_02705 [Alphaproteobacteria bacterium]|nr:hypothetical protein [Alphaproteobacteria bacterium]